eukprot:g3489.t1
MFHRAISVILTLCAVTEVCAKETVVHVLRGDRADPFYAENIQLDGTPGGYDETYGYPVTIGGLIIEGPFPYKNGPSTWSDDNQWGAYGLIAAPGVVKDGVCPPLPADSPFVNLSQHPVKLTNGVSDCLIGCNITEVTRTGKDPCHIGSISTPLSNSPMSCWDVGPGMAGGYGLCGYNCSAFQSANTKELTPCSAKDIGSGKCSIYCDSNTFPTKKN